MADKTNAELIAEARKRARLTREIRDASAVRAVGIMPQEDLLDALADALEKAGELDSILRANLESETRARIRSENDAAEINHDLSVRAEAAEKERDSMKTALSDRKAQIATLREALTKTRAALKFACATMADGGAYTPNVTFALANSALTDTEAAARAHNERITSKARKAEALKWCRCNCHPGRLDHNGYATTTEYEHATHEECWAAIDEETERLEDAALERYAEEARKQQREADAKIAELCVVDPNANTGWVGRTREAIAAAIREGGGR